MKKKTILMFTLFMMLFTATGAGPVFAQDGQTTYQDVEHYHFCHRCGMAIAKNPHVITIVGVPEQPWYQCCPICALMDVIESGKGNGIMRAFDNLNQQPIEVVISKGKIKTITPAETMILVGGSCPKNKIFTHRQNAMQFIGEHDWAKPKMLKTVAQAYDALKDKGKAANRCAMCANPLEGHEKTTMILITKKKKRLLACCPHCGLLMAHKLKDKLLRAVTPDFKTGKLIDAKKAHYVVDNDLVVCCFPSTLSFTKRSDAEAFQKKHNGVIMTFDQALANMSKVMGK